MSEGITLKGVAKSFNGAEVLHPVYMQFRYGQVHALVGENGAGKSTMMKIIAGIQPPTDGVVEKDGKNLVSFTPKEARERGIALIHQELSYISELTVAENIFLGREPRKKMLVDYKSMNRMTSEIFAELGLSIDPKTKMKDLRQASKQLVEIAKATSLDADVIIMDEPTSSLSYHETEKLFQLIRMLVLQDKCVIFISHKLDEIYKISDVISVLRDGQLIGSWPVNKIGHDDLIYKMVGRPLEKIFPTRDVVLGDVILSLEGLSREGEFKDISLNVRKGEILGIAGLVGAGRTETMQSVFGLHPYQSGKIKIEGQYINIQKPADAVKHGIAYIPEDRKEMGLVLMMSVGNNLSLSSLKELSTKFRTIDKKKEKGLIGEQFGSMHIKAESSQISVSKLSGGNQQKVVLGKWLAKNPKVLILDEPTKGVDVGAKYEIYSIMAEYAAKGNAVIMISSEMPELIGMSDRIVVYNNGIISGVLEKDEFSQESILNLEISGVAG